MFLPSVTCSPPPFMINSHQNNEKEREKHYLGFDSYK